MSEPTKEKPICVIRPGQDLMEALMEQFEAEDSAYWASVRKSGLLTKKAKAIEAEDQVSVITYEGLLKVVKIFEEYSVPLPAYVRIENVIDEKVIEIREDGEIVIAQAESCTSL